MKRKKNGPHVAPELMREFQDLLEQKRVYGFPPKNHGQGPDTAVPAEPRRFSASGPNARPVTRR